MPDKASLEPVFKRLRTILQKYEPSLIVKFDVPDHYYLDSPYSEKWKKEIMFGAAQIKKNYVSYYLFPIYVYPDLVDNISPALKKRMQGKSCFNFTTVDDGLLDELAQLTERSIERVRSEKLL